VYHSVAMGRIAEAAGLREWAAQALSSAVYEINTECENRIADATKLLQDVMRIAFPQEMTRLHVR
jgi:hypothetical protein